MNRWIDESSGTCAQTYKYTHTHAIIWFDWLTTISNGRPHITFTIQPVIDSNINWSDWWFESGGVLKENQTMSWIQMNETIAQTLYTRAEYQKKKEKKK